MSPRDPDDEFREIKREIIESRGLIIKTNNLTAALSADVKALARRQAGYERRLTVNSATAYVLFVVLTFGGIKLWLDASIRENRLELQTLRRAEEQARRDLSGALREKEERAQLDARAQAFYELVRDGRKQEAVETWEQLRRERLPPAELAFFQDVVDRFRTDLSLLAYERGLEHARMARYAEANEAYDEAQRLKDDAGHIPRVRLAHADALRHLGRQREAIVVLQAVAEGADREAADDALYKIAQCQVDLQQFGDARNTLRALLRRYPYGSVSNDARMYLAELSSPNPPRR
ncbi:MAG: tetratricopeptide repeat protein [Deltaproteobacteria bacterium]|nr:tetratricopeptide repeat protein [Deltaproteobacteria bacterium]